MADPYTELEDARILSTACYFASDDMEGPEEGMPLFGSVSDGIRTNYNWDQCFGNLEDVDNLLSSGPDLSFAVDSMQWHDSAAAPADEERWSSPQSGSEFMASDCLEDGEAMAGGVSSPEINGGTCVGMEMSEDGAGASFISHSESEKACTAQRARRRASNRRRRLKDLGDSFSTGSLSMLQSSAILDVPPPHKLRQCRHICCRQ